MDQERRLVDQLHCKLAELDQKVGKYRRDMVAEYERHAQNLLRSVPQSVALSVTQAIAASLGQYQALYPGTDACESGSSSGIISSSKEPAPPPDTTTTSSVTTSPLTTTSPPVESQLPLYSFPQPIPYRKSIQPLDDPDAPRSPHEREREFQGLFTPSYLPLLGESRHERRSSSSDIPTSPSLTLESSKVDASTDPRSLTSTPDSSRPAPKRRDTVDSFVSDTSEGTVRRSALRRSSSASMRSSPRRVRFDVEGVEVLPTSSPQPASSLLAEGDSLQDSDGDEPELEQVEDISYFPDEDEEESPPPPKRISSSQRLLALSREASKGDDGTTWTTVSAPPDGSPSIEKGANSNDSLSELSDAPNPAKLQSSRERIATPVASPNKSSSSSSPSLAINAVEDNDVDTESDDEGLDMPSLSSMKGKKSLPPAAILSPAAPTSYHKLQSPTSSGQISDRRWKDIESLGGGRQADFERELSFKEDDMDDGIFPFEEKPFQDGPPERPEADDEDDSDPTGSPGSPVGTNNVNLSQYSRSPGRPIVRPSIEQQSQATGSLGVIGSFRGHPFSMPVVNEDLHNKALAMGDVNSFVGSVDGRSGFDDGDMASYRATAKGASFSGVPRSLTERMMLDEMMENEKTKKMKH